MTEHNYDLKIRAGRVVCPASGIDWPGVVATRDGRIVAVGQQVASSARETFDVDDAVLLPGLIDLHAHPAVGGAIKGTVDPDESMLAQGTTTVLSQGDAGSGNWREYVRKTIEPSRTRVLMAMNPSSQGQAAPGGCFSRLEWIDVDACVEAIEWDRRHVWGISVNASHHCCGPTDPREVLRRGLQVAERTGLPILYGMRRPEDWPLDEQLRLLRRGDVVTYCFRREPHCIVENSRVRPSIRAARDRGILFDVGHGRGSFDFEVAEAALADGFPPDTISTDLQAGHLGQTPPHNLPLVMSKLRAAGMAECDVFAAVTSQPAKVLRLQEEIGSLKEGSSADLTLLTWSETGEPLHDVNGNERSGGQWKAVRTLRA